MERGKSMHRIIVACVMLTLLLLVAGCDSNPTPTPPPPTPTPTSIPTVAPKPVPSVTPQPKPSASPSPSPSPTALPSPSPLRPNPLAKIRAGELPKALGTVVDGTYCTPAWRDTVFPSTIALPVGPLNGDLLLEWNSSGTSDYISFPNAPTYGIPSSYTISTSADSTDGRNGTWRQVVSVTANTARTRAHRFPFSGARWVQMTVTGAVPGPLGNTFSIDEIDLHDVSPGSDDTVFFLGDSITAESFTRCPANQPSFAALVHQASPGWFPAILDGGVGGVNSGYGVSVVKDWLTFNPDFHIWAIGYGTNDAWQKVPPATFEVNLQTIIDKVVAAGRVPVLARIPFAIQGPADSDVRALNSVIDRLTARDGLVPGPDLYTWFKTHPDELRTDGVHPTDAGTRSINRLWYEALRRLYTSAP